MDVILDIQNITKYFVEVRALFDVNLQIERGEVHAIVGENGAGKSTLMKILGGVYKQDAGTVSINGKKINISNPAESMNYGISVVYQEFNLISDLTVAENMYITKMPTNMGFIKKREMYKQCDDIINSLKIDLNPRTLVEDLSVSQMQMVEIARAIAFDSSIIIMDEPTAALNEREVQTLYRIVKELKAKGKTILYISHRLEEIFNVSDRITVLKDGKKVNTVITKDINEEELIEMMIGREIEDYYHQEMRKEIERKEVILSVKHLTKKGYYTDISFDLYKGEILGLGGLMGSGCIQIAKSIFGMLHPEIGGIYINGEPVKIKSPIHSIENKIMLTTDDRLNEGIFPFMNVRDNITMAILSQIAKKGNGTIDKREEDEVVNYYKEYFNIKAASLYQNMLDLSGGNQQKVLLARSMATGCEVLILLEPTRGIDVGTKSEIYLIMRKLAAQGVAVLIASSETNEMLSICDRVITIFNGMVTGELFANEVRGAMLNEDNYMFGVTGNKRFFKNEVRT